MHRGDDEIVYYYCGSHPRPVNDRAGSVIFFVGLQLLYYFFLSTSSCYNLLVAAIIIFYRSVYIIVP